MTGEFRREALRKLFHGLSLVYLGVYLWLGPELFLLAISAFIVAEGTVELARLREPELNRALIFLFAGIHREAEERRISGVLWTSLGCAATVLLFGEAPRLVAAGLLCLALGDAAAALAGKAVGRLRFSIGGRVKSVEGSAACFAVCLLACRWAGLPWPAAAAAAGAATSVEASPVPLDDNLWIPLAAASAAFLTL